MNIRKKLQNMNLSDLKWICKKLDIYYSKNKNIIIKDLLYPLNNKSNDFVLKKKQDNGILFIGSHTIYKRKNCNKNHIRIKLCKYVLNILETKIKCLGIKLKKPKMLNDGKLCRSLWVRDMSLNINNNLFFLGNI